jgi:hypothetical protein
MNRFSKPPDLGTTTHWSVSTTTEWRSDNPHRQLARAGYSRLAPSLIFCCVSWFDLPKFLPIWIGHQDHCADWNDYLNFHANRNRRSASGSGDLRMTDETTAESVFSIVPNDRGPRLKRTRHCPGSICHRGITRQSRSATATKSEQRVFPHRPLATSPACRP